MRIVCIAAFAGAACVSLAAVPVQAKDCQSLLGLTTSNGAGVWAYVAPKPPAAGNRAAVPGWRPVIASATLPADDVAAMAYLGRTTAVLNPEREGAVALGLARKISGDEQPLTIVTMRRPAAQSSCGIRYYWPVWFADFVRGETAQVTHYIAYHATNTSPATTIEKYHISYRSVSDDCVGTDSAKGNRRTAFLGEYNGSPVRAEVELVENLSNLVATPATAEEAKPKKPRPISQTSRSIIRREVEYFKKLSSYESQIHKYTYGQRLCVLLNPELRVKGTTSVISAVDLDSGAQPSKRRTTWTVNWQ